MLRYSIGLAVAAALSAVPAGAATINFQQGVGPTTGYMHTAQDIRSNAASNTGQQLLVGYQSGTTNVWQIRTVMSFDLSLLDPWAKIDSISLLLVSDGSQSGTIAGVGAVNLHEIIPNGVASNNMVEGQISRDAWKSGSNWTTQMGDFNPTALSSAVLNNANANTVLDAGETATFPTSPDFVSAAQAAFKASQPLEFILLAPTAEGNTGATNFFRFRSDDFTATPADRPMLSITYTVPEPAGVAMLVCAGALMLRRRSRSSRQA